MLNVGVPFSKDFNMFMSLVCILDEQLDCEVKIRNYIKVKVTETSQEIFYQKTFNVIGLCLGY